MDKWDNPQDIVQIKRNKLKKLLVLYGIAGAGTGIAFGLYFSGIMC